MNIKLSKSAGQRTAITLSTFTLITIILFAGCSNPNYDIYSTIRGKVIDYVTGDPLSNVSIVLSPSNTTKTTNSDGSYNFENLDAGQFTLSFQKSGYYPDKKTITAISGEIMEVNVLLKQIEY